MKMAKKMLKNGPKEALRASKSLSRLSQLVLHLLGVAAGKGLAPGDHGAVVF